MRQLYYTLQTLIRGKGSNLIKIVSLGLGLAVSILIFSRQAFELNYDTCYKDHERLCLVKTVWYYNNEYHPSHITLGPVAGTIAENLPERWRVLPSPSNGGAIRLGLPMNAVSRPMP